jgi:hypothetical protein
LARLRGTLRPAILPRPVIGQSPERKLRFPPGYPDEQDADGATLTENQRMKNVVAEITAENVELKKTLSD